MRLIDVLFNIAGLLLWCHWRSTRYDPLVRTTPASLVCTLRRTEPRHVKTWQVWVGIALLMLVRAWLYWQIGSVGGVSGRIDVGLVVLAFRSDIPAVALLYSVVSYAKTLLIFYTFLIVLTLINRSPNEPGLVQKLIHVQLGRFSRWHWAVLTTGPVLIACLLWTAAHPAFVAAGSITPSQSWLHMARQGLLVGLALLTTIKYLLPPMLLFHLILNYVYLGASPVWDFVIATSRNLLTPLRRLPLRFGKVDFAPVIAAALILLVLDAVPNYLLNKYPDLLRKIWPS